MEANGGDSGQLHYTEEEHMLLLEYVSRLNKDQLSDFLFQQDLPKSGTKEDLKRRIADELSAGNITHVDLIDLLDRTAPSGKQHVFLYDGSPRNVMRWRDNAFVRQQIDSTSNSHLLEAPIPLILPAEMMLSSIRYVDGELLMITAVERRDHHQRIKEYDDEKIIDDLAIEYRAYKHSIDRGIAIFSWDLIQNIAMLQISQLESGSNYEEIEERFLGLVSGFMDVSSFQKLDLTRAIKKLSELEQIGIAETRSHQIGLRTLEGRSVSLQSPTASDSIIGEQVIDEALQSIRDNGVGQIGIFYWLPRSINARNNNPLESELRTVLVGAHSRINFPRRTSDEVINYVLSRVRKHCE